MTVLLSWLTSTSINDCSTDFPELPDVMLTADSKLPKYTYDILLQTLVRHGFYPGFLLSNMKQFTHYICLNNMLFSDVHPIMHYKLNIDTDGRERLMREFNKQFICFCEENDLVLLLFKFVTHYK